MALSAAAKKRLVVALASRVLGKEVADTINAGFAGTAPTGTGVATVTAGTLDVASKQLVNIAALGALATVVAPLGAVADVGTGAVDIACALATDVDARFETVSDKIDALIVGADARITTLQAKVDAVLATLKTKTFMVAD